MNYHPKKATTPGGIPRVFHQYWAGGEVPEVLSTLRRVMLLRNPGWVVRDWTPENLPSILHADLMAKVPGHAFKSDVLRYEIIAAHGGVWADWDIVWFRALEDFVAYAPNFFVPENPRALNNGIFGARPHDPVTWALVSRLRDSFERNAPDGPYGQVGCGYFSRVVKSFPETATVLPAEAFHPRFGAHGRYDIGEHPWAAGFHYFNSCKGFTESVQGLISEGKIPNPGKAIEVGRVV